MKISNFREHFFAYRSNYHIFYLKQTFLKTVAYKFSCFHIYSDFAKDSVRSSLVKSLFLKKILFQGLETANGQAPNAATTVVSNGKPYNVDQNNVVSSNNELVAVKSPVENRKPPEGKDNSDGSNGDLVGTEVIECKNEEIYSTDANNKVTVVHVVVTINGNGTLADLKKQRMQIRNSSSADVSNLNSPASTIETESITSPPNTDFLKLAGDTDDVVGYNMNRSPFGCCTIQ